MIIVPLRGSILQAETCKILSIAENSRWNPSVAKRDLSTAFVCEDEDGQGSFRCMQKHFHFKTMTNIGKNQQNPILLLVKLIVKTSSDHQN